MRSIVPSKDRKYKDGSMKNLSIKIYNVFLKVVLVGSKNALILIAIADMNFSMTCTTDSY